MNPDFRLFKILEYYNRNVELIYAFMQKKYSQDKAVLSKLSWKGNKHHTKDMAYVLYDYSKQKTQ